MIKKVTAQQKSKDMNQYIKTEYGKYFQKWKNEVGDDRLIYCNLYRMWLQAFKEMAYIENIVIWCSVRDSFRKDEQILKHLIKEYN